jgi:ubiquinone/menaquinone biosynthesis C-methylase UbiE
MENFLYDEIFKLEQEHWWFCAKRKIVLSVIQKYLPLTCGDLSVCDFGCGCGMMLMDLSKAGYKAIGLDSNNLALEYCRKRNAEVFYAEMTKKTPLQDSSIQCVTLLDALEHIEDEKKVLSEIIRVLKPGGIVVCTVPAYQWLWTKRDDFHHHKRRYQKSELVKLFESFGGFEILQKSYINCFLFPLALTERTIKKIFPPESHGDLTIPGFGINSLLKTIFASERLLINNNTSLPFGLSVLLTARKKLDDGRSKSI